MSRRKILFVILIVLTVACLSVGLVACKVNDDGNCEHVYEYKITVNPTLEMDGEVVVTCLKCDHNETVVIPKLSDLSEWNWSVSTKTPSTCTSTGIVTYTCAKPYAGLTVDVVTPKKEHTLGELIEEVASTCFTHGTMAHYQCLYCDALFDADRNAVDSVELPLADHDYGSLIAEVASTCLTHGVVAHYHCDVCGKDFDTDHTELTSLDLPLAEHNYGSLITGTPATCSANGTIDHYECSVCGEMFDSNFNAVDTIVIDALSHNYDQGVVTVEPTCISEGVKTYTCSVCGDTKTESIAMVAHNTDVIIPEVPATCTESGLTEGKMCSVCGEIVVKPQVIDALGHSYDEGVITVEPTCITEGVKTYTCLDCGDVYTESIDKIAHVEVIDDAVAPTCTESGLTSGSHCSVCGETIIAQQVVDALGHSYDQGVITTEPSCTHTGVKTYTCLVCGDTKTEIVEKSAHVEVSIPAVDPTCTENGLTEGSKCSVCGEIIVAQQVVDALGHSYDEGVITTVPTCTHKGVKTYTCLVCGDTKTESIEKTAHVETPIPAVAPTCTESGWTEGVKCSVCGEILVAQQVVDALGHTWAWVVDVLATKLETGIKHEECSVCHETRNQGTVIEKTDCDHIYARKIEKVEADCTHDGKEAYWYCSDCDRYFSDEDCQLVIDDITSFGIIQAKGHVEIEIPAVPATCTESGWTAGVKCSECGEILVAPVFVEALDHDWDDGVVTTKATCTVTGVKTYTCGRCGETKTEVIDALGHEWDDGVVTIAPSYENAGELTYTCGHCGETRTEIIERLKYIFEDKTYAVAEYTVSSDSSNTSINAYIRTSATLFLVGNKATCESYPFRGDVEIVMKDVETGKIAIELYTQSEDGQRVLSTTYNGYVGDNGIIVLVTANRIFVLVPYEISSDGRDFVASIWDGVDQGMAITYTHSETQYNIFIHNDNVYFDVTFTDASDEVIVANEVYNASLVNVKRNGELVIALGYDGSHLVTLDGHQGVYVGDQGDLVFNGLGRFVWGEKKGTYSYNELTEMYELYVQETDENVEYYDVYISDAEYVADKATVTVTLDFGSFKFDGETPENVISVNKNISYTLPVYMTDTQIIQGWIVKGTTDVVTSIVPTADVELSAVINTKVVVYLTGVLDGDPTVVYLGDGETIGSVLPSYVINSTTNANGELFAGWFYDIDGELIEVDYSTVISVEDSGITVVATWKSVPAIVGTWHGFNLYGTKSSTYTASKSYTVTIGQDGKVASGAYQLTAGSLVDLTKYGTLTDGALLIGSKYAYINAKAGVLWYGYGSTSTGVGTDTCLMFSDKVATVVYSGAVVDSKYAGFLTITYVDGSKMNVLLYNNTVIADVTWNEGVTADKAQSNSNLTISKNGKSFIGYINKHFVEFDGIQGTYTDDSTTPLVLDGMGNFTWGEKSGVYNYDKSISADSFSMFVVENGKNVEYYEVVIGDDKFIADKPMVTVTLESEFGTFTDIGTVNKNIAITLPDLADSTHFFRGWYLATDETQTVLDSSYLPIQSVTLVAKWTTKITVKVVYGEGIDDDIYYIGYGDVAPLVAPAKTNGKVFDYWYLSNDDGLTVSSIYNASAEVTENITVYVAWMTPPVYMNDYYGVQVGTSLTSYSSNPLSFNKDGVATPDGTIFKKTNSGINFTSVGISVSISVLDETTGRVKISYVYDQTTESDDDYGWGSSTTERVTDEYFGYIDSATGIIVINNSKGENSTITAVYLLVPASSRLYGTDIDTCSSWNGNKTKPFVYKSANDERFGVIFHNNEIYLNASFYGENDEPLTSLSNANKSKLFIAKDANGDVIVDCAYNGSEMVSRDGHQGVYSVTYGEKAYELIFDGMGGVTTADKSVSGTYTLDSATATFELYLTENDVLTYYTLEKDANVLVKPMVTITYVTDYGTADSVSVNKNIQYTLITVLTESDHVFMGWYIQGDSTKTIVESVVPSEDMTLVALWQTKVYLTLVYGNGYENETYSFASGSSVDLSLYTKAYTNGKLLSGWYVDQDCTVEATLTVIEADTTLYAKWVTGDPYVIEDVSSSTSYAWKYDSTNNTYTSGNKNINNSKSVLKITTYADVMISLKYACSSESDYRWDYFHIDIDGVKKVSWGASTLTNFKDYVVKLPAGSVITLTYEKDGSGTGGDDQAIIKDLTIVAHTCVYDQRVESDEFLKTPATCQKGAEYYLSCTCGDHGEETFVSSTLGAHNYVDHVCTECGINQPSFTLTLVKNNGENDEILTIYDGEIIDFDSIKPTKAGYGFKGWFTTSTFDEGTEFTSTTLDENVTVYANWAVASAFAGYTFSGSYYDENEESNYAISITFDESADITGIFTRGTWNSYIVRFTATFVDNTLTLNITENIQYSPSWVGKNIVATLSGDTLTVVSTTVSFNGLFTFANNGTLRCAGFEYVEPTPHTHVFDIQNPTEANKASIATCQHPATYYYVCECGEVSTTDTFEYGDTADHHYVDGYCEWCQQVAPKTMFDVIFVLGNGSEDIIISVEEGCSLGDLMPADPTKDGFVFNGWFVGEQEFTSDTIVNSELTVKATWKEKTIPAIVGTWKGFNLYVDGTSYEKDLTSSTSITVINADGTISDSAYRLSDGSVVDLTEYDSVIDGALVIGDRYAYLNATAGILWYGYNKNETGVGDDTCFMVDERVTKIEYSGAKFKSYSASYVAWITVYYNDGTSMNVLLYNNRVYDNVSWNEGVSAKEVYNSTSKIIVEDKNDVAIIGYVNKTFVAVDNVRGAYTQENASDLVLDGMGSFVWGDKSGTYNVIDSETIEMYVVVDGENSEYYETLIINGEYIEEKVMVEILLMSDYGTFDDVISGSVNKNIAVNLPSDLTDDYHVFLGWYDSDDENTIVPFTYIPTKDVVLSAKWANKITLTVVYGNGLDNEVLEYAEGDITAPQEPALTNGMVFDHWYLSDDNGKTEKAVYTPSAIVESVVIYCAWKRAHALFGDYIGFETYGTGHGQLTNKYSASIDAYGKALSGENITNCIADYDAKTGFVVFGNYRGYYDSVNSVLVYNDKGGTDDQNDVYVLFKNASKVTASNANQISWNGGRNKLIDVTVEYADGTTKAMILYFADKVIQSVSYTTEPSGVAISDMYASREYKVDLLTIFDNNGAEIGSFAPSSAKNDLLPLDGSQGTYTAEGREDLVLSGTGTATIGANVGTVTKAEEGSAYSYDLYITESGVNVYYELTIDVATKTYSVVKPMVTISFDLDGKGTIADVVVNKNIAFDLSSYEPTYDGYKFKGWYSDETFATKLSSVTPTGDTVVYAKWNPVFVVSFETEHGDTPASKLYESGTWCYYGDRPTLTATGYVFRGWYVKGDADQTLITAGYQIKSDVTFVAKWVDAISLTIVYNKDNLPDAQIFVAAGDKFSLDSYKPDQASDGMIFDNWYVDADCTTVFDATSITENTVIYCGWKEAHVLYGEYKGAEFDPSETSDVTMSKSSHGSSLSISDAGVLISGTRLTAGYTFTFTGEGLFTVGNASYQYGGGYDAKYGILYYDYYDGKYPEPYHDIYLMFKTIKKVTVKTSVASVWEAGCTKLIKATYSDGSTLNVFIYNRRVYGGVTFVATDVDGNQITDVSQVYSANKVCVLDDQGNWIAGFSKDDSNKLTYDENVKQHTHTPAEAIEENRVESTCTVAGHYDSVVKCSECGEEISRETITLELAKHTPAEAIEENRVESTCTVAGHYDSVIKCSKCGEEISRETITLALAEHTPADAVEENRVESTCTVAGSYDSVVKCSKCGAEISRETITLELAEHTPAEAIEENRVESTCTVAGHYDSVVKCSECGEELSRETITLALAEHTPAEAVEENRVESTCTVAGHYDSVVKCSECGAEISRETITLALAEHTRAEAIEENREESTCIVAGHYDSVVKCSECGEELSRETITLALAEHTPAEAVEENRVESTCTVAGHYDSVVKCSECGAEISRETITLALAEHTRAEAIEENREESTCIVAGHYDSVVKCSECGEELSRETITLALAEHTYGELIAEVSATCTDNGVKAHKDCSVCNKHFDTDGNELTDLTITALGHNYTWSITTEPTTDNYGSYGTETGTCQNDNTHVVTRNCALTIEEAIKLIDDGNELTDRYVLARYAGKYSTNGIYLTDSTSEVKFVVYRPTSSITYDDIHDGDLVLVKGDLTKYNSLYELASGGEILGFAHADSCYTESAINKVEEPAKEYNKTMESLKLNADIIVVYGQEVIVSWSIKETEYQGYIVDNVITLPTDESVSVTLVVTLTYGESVVTKEYGGISLVAINAHVHSYNPANQTCEVEIDGVKCGAINPAYLTKTSVGAKKNVLFGSGYNQKNTNGYEDNFATVSDGMTWTITNFNNNNSSWAFVRCGRKVASVATMTSPVLDFAVESITVSVDSTDASKVNSFSLTVKNGDTVIETIDGTMAVGDVVFKVTTPKAGYTYVLTVDCQKKSNGFVQISKLVVSEQSTSHVSDKDPSGIQIVPATCISEGSVSFLCSDCGEIISNTIPVIEHNYVWTDEVPATCINDGSIGHYHCDGCNKDYDSDYNELDSVVINATGEHSYARVEDLCEEPTCTKAGAYYYACTTDGCNADYIDEIDPLGHIDDDKDGICDRCKESVGYALTIEYELDGSQVDIAQIDMSLLNLSWDTSDAINWITQNVKATVSAGAVIELTVDSTAYSVTISVSGSSDAEVDNNVAMFSVDADVTVKITLERTSVTKLTAPELLPCYSGEDSLIMWNDVENAVSYGVKVGDFDEITVTSSRCEIKYIIEQLGDIFASSLSVTVTIRSIPASDSAYYDPSDYSTPLTLVKLATPEVNINNGVASWDPITNAIGYDYLLDGNLRSASELSVTLTDGQTIQVKACGTEDNENKTLYLDSDYSEKQTYTAPVASALATFTLGDDGSASHVDGSSKTTYTETKGTYTLSLTSMSSVYTGARDKTGNGCLKLGTGSKAGSFTFTVGDSVNKVVIYVAAYKTTAAKITVNGSASTISTPSDEGSYTAIEIDVSTNKTVTFATVSGGYRCMINTIDFWA